MIFLSGALASTDPSVSAAQRLLTGTPSHQRHANVHGANHQDTSVSGNRLGAETKAVITITSPAPTAVVGGDYTPTASSTSGGAVFIYIDPTSVSTCQFFLGTVTFQKVGVCTVDFSDIGRVGFAPADTVQQSFTINRGQAVLFGLMPVPTFAPVGGSPFIPHATSTSGNDVTITVAAASAPVCQMIGGYAYFVGVGTCTLNFSDDGNSNFTAAVPLQQSFTVSRGTAVITVFNLPPSHATAGGAPLDLLASSTSGNPVVTTIPASASNVCQLQSGSVTFTGVGTCTVNFNDSGNLNYSAATPKSMKFAVVRKTGAVISLSPRESKVVFGTSSPIPTADSTSGNAVDAAVDPASAAICSLVSGKVVFQAAGRCTLDYGDPGNADYLPAVTVRFTFVVSKAVPIITFPETSAATLVPSAAPIQLSPTSTSGDVVRLSVAPASKLVCTLVGSSVTLQAAGTCQISYKDSGNRNYSSASGNLNLVVTAAISK